MEGNYVEIAKMKHLVCGGFAGVTVDLALFPLDVIKTRIQAKIQKKGNIQPKNFRGFYAGLSSAMIGSFPASSAFFGTYEITKHYLKDKNIPKWSQHMLAASAGEIMGSIIRVPCEIVKQQMQVGMHRNVSSTVQSIISAKGLIGMWTGLGTTVCREIPFSCIQFSLWERMKLLYQNHYHGTSDTTIIHPFTQAVFGSISGGIAALFTTPLDVAKTRLMTQSADSTKYHGVISTMCTIGKEEGFKALFLGVIPRVMWISVGGFIYFGSYSTLCKLYDTKN